MVDLRKYLIILVVGVLFSVFVFALIDTIYPRSEYSDFCNRQDIPVAKPLVNGNTECLDRLEIDIEDRQACSVDKGYIAYEYDEKGCAVNYYCETCQKEYETAANKQKLAMFYLSALLSLIAIIVGLYLPAEKNSLNEWIGTGFMLGGTFALFFGTVVSYSSLGRFIRPIVIFIELVLVIFIAYRKTGNLRNEEKKR